MTDEIPTRPPKRGPGTLDPSGPVQRVTLFLPPAHIKMLDEMLTDTYPTRSARVRRLIERGAAALKGTAK